VYKTPNLFCLAWMIYFFADVPHLIKTARNCLYNSGSGSCSWYMWNDGQHLLFRHIANMYYCDQEFTPHRLPKLTLDHVVLTSFSMKDLRSLLIHMSKSLSSSFLKDFPMFSQNGSCRMPLKTVLGIKELSEEDQTNHQQNSLAIMI
jgi:hypothetical protein